MRERAHGEATLAAKAPDIAGDQLLVIGHPARPLLGTTKRACPLCWTVVYLNRPSRPLDHSAVGQTASLQTPTVTNAREDRAAVDKAISLLLSFGSQAATGIGVSELARRASLSKSTAFRVLGMLERNGVVERIGSSYRFGQRLHDLGTAVYSPEHDRIREVLTPFLADLYEFTRETVHVATLHDTDVVYLAKL